MQHLWPKSLRVIHIHWVRAAFNWTRSPGDLCGAWRQRPALDSAFARQSCYWPFLQNTAHSFIFFSSLSTVKSFGFKLQGKIETKSSAGKTKPLCCKDFIFFKAACWPKAPHFIRFEHYGTLVNQMDWKLQITLAILSAQSLRWLFSRQFCLL